MREKLLGLIESVAAADDMFVKNNAEMTKMIRFGTTPLKVNLFGIAKPVPDNLIADPNPDNLCRH